MKSGNFSSPGGNDSSASPTSATSRDLAAYARLDRQLSRLGTGDCLLVLGRVPCLSPQPVDPDDTYMPLEAVVNGWLELAQDPAAGWTDRRVA